jgi:hypothetical protein
MNFIGLLINLYFLPDESKFNIVKTFSKGNIHLKLGNGKQYNMKNFAEILKTEGSSKTESYYRDLKMLKRYLAARATITAAKEAWSKVKTVSTRATGTVAEQEVINTVATLIWKLDETKLFKDFEVEYESATANIMEANLNLEHNIGSYFTSLGKPLDFDFIIRFSKARVVQLTEKAAEEGEDKSFLTAEELIHELPLHIDLNEEIYRYSLIEGFQKILKEVRPSIQKVIADTAQKQIGNFLSQPSTIKSQLEAYIGTMDEVVFEKWIQVSPSAIFQQLNQSPQDCERILYAIEKMKEDLQKTDYEALKSVTSNRRTFRAKIRLIMQSEKKKLDEIMDHRRVETKYETKAQYIKLLEKLESDAVNSNPVNYPYIDYLFKKGIIDSSVYSKWIPVDKITRKDFLESLGTKEDFTTSLLSKFKKDLLHQIENPPEKKNQIINIEKKASQILAKSYLEKIDNKAKSFYLTKDAFLKANSMNFDKALNAYNLEAVKEMILTPDPQELAKAYVEACVPEKVTNKQGFKFPYQHFIDEFLTQIKIPQSMGK